MRSTARISTLLRASLAAAALAGAALAPAARAQQSIAWTPHAPMPTPRGGGVAAFVDGNIVVAGGSNRNDPPPSGALATVESYDPASNTWSQRPILPEARFAAAGGVVGHTLYVAGGTTVAGLSGMVLAYDTATGDAWFDGAVNLPRFRHGGAVIGSRLYLVGGWSGGPLDSVEAYDLDEHTSYDLAPLPAPRDLPTVVAVGGILYALGGFDPSGAPATEVWAYDPLQDAWTPRAPLLDAPGGASAVAASGRIVVLGGNRSGGPTPTDVLRAVQVYDPAANSWSKVGELDVARFMTMASAIGAEVYLVGGRDATGPLGLTESFTLLQGYPPTSVIESPPAGAALNLHTIVLSGTASDDQAIARVEVSTNDGASWYLASGGDFWTYSWWPLVEGEYVLRSRATDVNGMVQEEPYPSYVIVDWTGPSILASAPPPTGQQPSSKANAWWNTPVTWTFECSDALSGVASCPAPVVFSTEGLSGAYATATDGAGNQGSTYVSALIDLTPPSISLASASPPANAAGWWSDSVTLSFTCTDALSGLAACAPPVTVDSEGAGLLATATGAKDWAGNVASASFPVNIDRTPPEIVAEPTTPPNAAGWWNQPVTVKFTCTDALSDVASCPEPTTTALECPGCSVDGWANDRAGNFAYGSTMVRIDTTAPDCQLAFSGSPEADGTFHSSVIVSVQSWDPLSGLDSLEVDTGSGFVPYGGPFVLSAPGTTVVTCRARDVAGNEGLGWPYPVTIRLPAELRWADRAPMPVPTTRAVSGVVDRTLYVLGGVDAAGDTTAGVWAYDAEANLWRAMPPLPEPRTSAAAETLGGTIYVAGGIGGPTTLSTVVAYDVATGASRVVATLEQPRNRAGAAINAGKLYVVGGAGVSVGALDSVEEIDLATGASAPRAPLPAPRQQAGVATYGGWLYVMGGLDAAAQPTDTCWKLRLATAAAAWTPCAALPYPRSGDALHGHGRILLANNAVSSGLPPSAWTADVLAYDPTADAWSVAGQKPAASRGSAFGVVQDALYVAGGTDGTAQIATTIAAPLHVPDAPVLPWQLRARMPEPESGATAVVVDGRIVLLAGTSRNDMPPSGALATVQAYDPATNAWQRLTPLPEPRYHAPGGAVDGVAYLAGGTTPTQPYVADVLAYDVKTGGSWIDGSLLVPRSRHGAAVLGHTLYVAGGRSQTALLTSVEAYDLVTHASTLLAPLPGTRDMARVVAAGGRLFVLGGYEASGASTMLEYDFAGEAWVSRTPPPLPVGGAPVVAVGPSIVALGGAISGPAPTEVSDLVQVYDTASGTWTVLGALDTFRFRGAAAYANGWLYLAGGDDGALPQSLVEAVPLDGTAPASAILSPADGAFTNAHQLVVSGTATDDVGLLRVDVSDDGATWTRASGEGDWSWAWVPAVEGAYVLRSRATDVAGFVEDPPATSRVTVDWTPPHVASCATPAGSNTCADPTPWTKGPVTVGFECADALSGVAICPEAVTVSGETPAEGLRVSGTAADRAGNTTVASATVRIDRTAPTCAVSTQGALGADQSYVSDVRVIVTAADAASGVARVEVSTGTPQTVGKIWTPYGEPFAVTTDGETAVRCRATDVAENSGEGSRTFTIDRAAPTVLVTSPPENAFGVALDAPITITFSETVVAGPAWSQIALLDGKKLPPITVSISGSVVTIRALDGLDRNRDYVVSVPWGAVTDTAGNAFAGAADGAPYRVDFSTGTHDNGPSRSGRAVTTPKRPKKLR